MEHERIHSETTETIHRAKEEVDSFWAQPNLGKGSRSGVMYFAMGQAILQ